MRNKKIWSTTSTKKYNGAKSKASTPGGGAGEISVCLYPGDVRHFLLWRPNYKAPVKQSNQQNMG